MKDKKGVGMIGIFMLFLVFVIIWFVWLGKFLGEIGAAVVIDNNLSGIEGFFFDNLNLFIFLIMLLGILGYAYLTSGDV